MKRDEWISVNAQICFIIPRLYERYYFKYCILNYTYFKNMKIVPNLLFKYLCVCACVVVCMCAKCVCVSTCGVCYECVCVCCVNASICVIERV